LKANEFLLIQKDTVQTTGHLPGSYFPVGIFLIQKNKSTCHF
jgi:hypothetical protein